MKGQLLHANGLLNINGGELVVEGDYRMQTKLEDGSYIYSHGVLRMVNPADKVLVHGNFYMDSLHSHHGQLTAGVLELKGNFEQLFSSGGHNGNAGIHNFLTSGTHQDIFSGQKVQFVSFVTPGNSYFNEVIYRNGLPGNIRWTSAVAVAKPILVAVRVSKTSGMMSMIADNSGQIQCGTKCEMLVVLGSELRLEIALRNNESLKTWAGGCSHQQPVCTFTVTDVVHINAVLEKAATKRKGLPWWVLMAAQKNNL